MVVKGSNQTFYTTNNSSSKKHSHNSSELFDPPTISLTPASKAKLAQQLSSFQDTIEKKERLSHLQHSFFRKYKQQQLQQQNTTTPTPTRNRHYKRTMDNQTSAASGEVLTEQEQPPPPVVVSEAPSSAEERVDEATTSQLLQQERQPQDDEASNQQASAAAEAERPPHDPAQGAQGQRHPAQAQQAEQPQEVIDLTSVVEEDLHQRVPPPAPERVTERPPVAPAAAAEEESQQQHKEFSKRLLVLVSNSQFNRKSSADSSRAMTMLALKNLPYEIVDGMDPAQKERRNALFELSGRRGVYPQFFLVSSDDSQETTVVGDMETIDGINDCSAMPAELLEANPGIVTWERLLR